MTVNVLLEDSFDGHQGNDLYDPERTLYRIFRVKKNMTLQELLEQLSETLVGNIQYFKLYIGKFLELVINFCELYLCIGKTMLIGEINCSLKMEFNS